MEQVNEKKPSICIVAHNAYGALSGGLTGHVGGAENQTVLLARWLAKRGYPTSLLTWDEGQPNELTMDGVRVIGICRADAGIPGLRFIHPRTTGLFASMRRANANIYYHNSAESITGLVAAWCRLNGRVFIYSVASDVACECTLPAMSGFRDRALYRYGVRHASGIILQTRRQQELLKDSFSRDSIPLSMPCRLSAAEGATGGEFPSAVRVAWVGRIVPLKRIEWLLDIAERMPDVRFDVVGANIEDAMRRPRIADYANNLLLRIKTIANVSWHGALPSDEVIRVLRGALCLCCTSMYEGFPNTFLEAWSQGCPVVSSFDPDGLIESREMGSYSRNIDEFVGSIRGLVASPEMRSRQSRNAMRYFSETHALDIAMPRFEQEILAVWKNVTK